MCLRRLKRHGEKKYGMMGRQFSANKIKLNLKNLYFQKQIAEPQLWQIFKLEVRYFTFLTPTSFIPISGHQKYRTNRPPLSLRRFHLSELLLWEILMQPPIAQQ